MNKMRLNQLFSNYIEKFEYINKAQVEYLVMLARILCCDIEDILEKVV